MANGFSVPGYALFKSLTPEKIEAGRVRFAKSGAVSSEVDYFRARAAACETPDDFVKNYRLLRFALTAYSMEDQLRFPARIKQILKDDPGKESALVNRMKSEGYKEINADFAFATEGVKKLQDPAFIDKVVRKFQQAQYETSLGNANPALSDALYFQRKIGKVKSTYEIISDPVLFNVTRVALDIPNAAVSGDVRRMKKWIDAKLDVTKLGDPAYAGKLVDRFLALSDIKARKDVRNGLLDLFA